VFLTISEFIGHLHPVLVHLPIGILLLACLFLGLSQKEKFAYLKPAISITLFLGVLCAVVTCVTGYILSDEGGYDERLVQWHQWLGISVALISGIIYLLHQQNRLVKWQITCAALLTVLIGVTGHLGGSLTHGSDYLTKPLHLDQDSSRGPKNRKPIADIQQAWVYTDIMEPIFEDKCYGCHSATKQKGKLRLDQADLIIKGGKDGVVIIPGKAAESELIKRVLSPREEEHHMPPKEKPQLSEEETDLLQWWVNQGADFAKKVKDIPQSEKVKLLLTDLQNPPRVEINPSNVPAQSVAQADPSSIQLLRDKGIVVTPVAQNSHFLAANFVGASDFHDRDIHLLLSIKNQLIWLKIGYTAITDSAVETISYCTNLTELQLDHTQITDKGLVFLTSLANLQSLNLVGTKISSAGVMKLASLKNLRFLYLYQTQIDKKDWGKLVKAFPTTVVDSGGYTLPYIKSDTQTVKAPKPVY
jgi:uncharacterized membrane protein